MDCGPAALKALLDGFGISASYGRLREACQTDVDGTSVNDIEETAIRLGLDAQQVMLPADHMLLSRAHSLPALCVVRLPTGLTHFIVAWKRHGAWIQLMDPATGRRWSSARRFIGELYQHTQAVPAAAWREWSGGEEFQSSLDERMHAIAIGVNTRNRLAAAAAGDITWRGFATLDAGTRMTTALVDSGGIRHGTEADGLLESLVTRGDAIPDRYWSVRPSRSDAETLLFRGVVLVRVRGRAAAPRATHDLPPELLAALEEKPPRPGRELLRMMGQDGVFAPAIVAAGVVVSAGTVILEALVWRGMLEWGRDLNVTGQRLAAGVAVVTLMLALLLLEWPLSSLTLRLGRRLESRFRQAFLYQIPRLNDRYFQSRLISDMAERSHSIHQLRQVPDVGVKFVRSSLELVATVIGIWWLYPRSVWLASLTALAAIAIPMAAQPYLAEKDMRVRNRAAAMSRFYLDALLGGTMLRAHGAMRAMRREHGALLGQWARAALAFQRTIARIEVMQLTLTLITSAWLLSRHAATTGDLSSLLLLAYWTLNLPLLGEEAASAAWQYPHLRNIVVRLFEPLGAPQEHVARFVPQAAKACSAGAAVTMQNVSARAGGHTILEGINVDIPAGQHVAIVGESGAGKSSLVGLLLGWLRPSTGSVLVDGFALDATALAELRRESVWVDPTVQVWNRSLYDNLTYGADTGAAASIDGILDAAQLRDCVHRLPDGMDAQLGDGGGLLSGGEGQRVRFGRGLMRPLARLVILDEPARGLDRSMRLEILRRCREQWPKATLICVTHDVAQTLEFPRVIVMHRGRAVEDGPPAVLAANSKTLYSRMLESEHQGRRRLWSADTWRRVMVRDGTVGESAQAGGA
jgi:ATP-binding cassette subfamily B protein